MWLRQWRRAHRGSFWRPGLAHNRLNETVGMDTFSHFGRIRQSDFDREPPAGRLPDCPRPSTPNVTRGCASYSKPGARRPVSRKRPLPSGSESLPPTSRNTSLATVGLMCSNFWTLPPRSALIRAPSSTHCCGDELARSPPVSRGATPQRHNLTTVLAGQVRCNPLAHLVTQGAHRSSARFT